MTSPLFRPFATKSLSLPNRLVMAPMTRSKSPGSIPGADVAAYYRRRAEGGVGLIVTEGTTVDRPAASNDTNVPDFHSPAALAGWRRVVEEVHAAGGKIAPQIWHVGSARGQGPDWTPLGRVDSPSGLVAPGKPKYEPMTEEDIADTIAAFGRSARAARELGFDAVESHMGHGYLLNQFISPLSNKRRGEFGGCAEDRARFPAEVLATRSRDAAAPTFSPDGLYFLGPVYDAAWGLPSRTAAYDALP